MIPKKSFGQHFLADPTIAVRIAELASTEGTILEIGPGEGALTKHLLPRSGAVVALERDRDLAPLLADTFRDEITAGKLLIIEADAKTNDWIQTLSPYPRPHVVAGNIPYNITGPLLERAIHASAHLDRVVFMVQKEVADRLAAVPGTKAYGALTVFASAAFSIRRAMIVKAGSFRPPPRVDSAVIVMTPLGDQTIPETDAFRELVKRAFSARRKTLRNAWRGVFGAPEEQLRAAAAEAGVSLEARGETLDAAAFARVAKCLKTDD